MKTKRTGAIIVRYAGISSQRLRKVVIAKDAEGKYFLTPEARIVRPTTRDVLELYLLAYKRGAFLANPAQPTALWLLAGVNLLVKSALKASPAVAKALRMDGLKRRGERKNIGCEQAMAMEVLRLLYLQQIIRAKAIDAVAGAFEKDVRTVQRAVKKWERDIKFHPDHIQAYEENLVSRRLLP